MRVPSGLHAAERTGSVWPSRTTTSPVPSAFHTRAVLSSDVATIRVHGDCHIGNLLWTDHGPHFVDLDDAMNGPAVQDLWMLLSGDGTASRAQVRALLGGYESFREFDERELALVEPLRTLRMIHHSAWIAKRWKDPAFPAAFPWFGTPSYWQEQIQLLRERLE